jgi:hypothetical protein
MSVPKPALFPEPPPGIVYLRSRQELLARRELDAYQHLLMRAWRELKLDGVLVVRGIPTVYLREDEAEISPEEVHSIQQRFWNQGVATLLVLVDRKRTRVFSGMVPPQILTVAQRAGTKPIDSFVEELDIAAQALRAHRADAIGAYHTFCRQIVSGQFYRKHNPEGKAGAKKFDPHEMVDAYLLDQLAAVRDELTRGKNKLPVEIAHAFLGRLLFTCYLIDRRIVILSEGKYFPREPWNTLQDVLNGPDDEVFERLYKRLFPQLKRDFNGSMFNEANLDDERDAVRPAHLKVVRDFFAGDDIGKNQRTLGFWAYDFSFIPVETISAIYENFLKKEGESEKREDGAYYTPRFLAEMTLDVALEGCPQLRGKRFLDASCGSGIFLVLLFNRLASEWTAEHRKTAFASTRVAYRAKDAALRNALANLCGVDKNLTACRIACFSLYLAFLDRFTPRDIRTYIQQSETNKLPNLLRFKDGKGKRPDIPVIWEGNFFALAAAWSRKEDERFDYAIGNPPWAGRGKKQTAQDFMAETPRLLRLDGKAALLLPTKVFFNNTDAFQSQWLRAVTLEKVVLLADYSFILFTNALCPCLIARFNPKAPAVETHLIEYLTPKVTRVDLRQGAIPIAPGDRKEIPLRLLLGAALRKATTVVWKSHFWGTTPDVKFLQQMLSLPRLAAKAGTPRQVAKGLRHWSKGQGFQPLKPGQKITGSAKPIITKDASSWSLEDKYVDADQVKGVAFFPPSLCETLGVFLRSTGRLVDKVRRKPNENLFNPPLVLLNQGFTGATFFDFRVRFQDTLQSIAGPRTDANKLLFLAAYLRSRLARYFAFHTSSNIGMERDKVHLDEVLSLPFYLPDDADALSPKAETLMHHVVSKLKDLQARMMASAQDLEKRLHPKSFTLQSDDEQSLEEEHKKWLTNWAAKTASVQQQIEPLLCDYFALNSQERALIADTWCIFDRSDTPGTLDTPMPTLEAIGADGIGEYATMLADTMREWSREKKLAVNSSAGVDAQLGIAVLRIEQTRTSGGFRTAPLSRELAEAVRRVEESATTSNGSLIYLRDETWWFDGPRIFIAKPALKGRWTCTAALCDAGDMYAAIQLSRQQLA